MRGRLRKKQQEHPEGGGLVVGERARAAWAVVCASCGHALARATDRIAVAGAHEHTFVNPHRFVFRIACYRRADGAAGVGEWTGVHTWFAGYRWRVLCCGRCSIHVGWAYRAEADGFVGLIADRIEERDQ